MSAVLAGGFFTTEPLEKPMIIILSQFHLNNKNVQKPKHHTYFLQLCQNKEKSAFIHYHILYSFTVKIELLLEFKVNFKDFFQCTQRDGKR